MANNYQFQQNPDYQMSNDHASDNASSLSIPPTTVPTQPQSRRTIARVAREHAAALNLSGNRHNSAKGNKGRSNLAPTTTTVDSSRGRGLILNMAKEARRVQGNSLAAKPARVQKLRDQTMSMKNKAKEEAKLKALERAIEGITLDAKITTLAVQSSTQPLILSLENAMTFIIHPGRAREAYNHLPASLADPAHIKTLSNKLQKKVRLLIGQEDKLRVRMKDSGSIEAALLHQDERIAFTKQRNALHDQLLLADKGARDLQDEKHNTPTTSYEHPPTFNNSARATASTSNSHSVLDTMTDRQKAADHQTSEDLIAPRKNPNLRRSRKRRTRLENAKKAGRPDLCAMEVDHRLPKAEEAGEQECEQTAKPDTAEPRLSPGDALEFPADGRRKAARLMRSYHQGQDTEASKDLPPDQDKPSRDNSFNKPIKRGRRVLPAKGVAASEAQSYRPGYNS
ncbi:MAG: hypothetical protein Q9221_008038 [Calogaya cf. arnoldii]